MRKIKTPLDAFKEFSNTIKFISKKDRFYQKKLLSVIQQYQVYNDGTEAADDYKNELINLVNHKLLKLSNHERNL